MGHPQGNNHSETRPQMPKSTKVVPSPPAVPVVMARTLGAAIAAVPEENLNFLNKLSSAAVAAQHATSTRTGYAYWLGRFERFCVNPSERLVMAGEAGIPLAVVFSPNGW